MRLFPHSLRRGDYRATRSAARVLLLVCLTLPLVPTNLAAAQEPGAVAAPAAPGQQRPETFLWTGQGTAQRRRAPQAAKPAVPATAAAPAHTRPPQLAPAAPVPPPPPRVVTVVHRLSGWRLLSALAASAPPALELDDLPSATDVHTNVVAGFLSDDNRTVVVRLPRAEAAFGATILPSSSGGFFPQGVATGRSEFTLVLGDGQQVPANFVGLDSATGLSLLEAARPVSVGASGDEGHTEDPTVGQRVVLYAPAPVSPATPVARMAPAARPGPSGDEGVVYAGIGQAEARLTGVTRTPAGLPFAVTASAANLGPAWAGAVATDLTGSLVGIVAQTGAGGTQIVPVENMRRAIERVKATRSSVPQPWLGARGDAAFNAPLEFWVNQGWEPDRAFSLIKNKRGVLLTSVAPGTPAALAGLRPGDLIAGVGGRDVTTVQDFSQALKEQPLGSAVEFTVLRAPAQAPIRVPVQLSATRNPAVATAEAEARAARENLLALRAQLNAARAEQRRLAEAATTDAAVRATVLARLREVEVKLDAALRESAEAERRVFEARTRTLFDAQPLAPAALAEEFAKRPLLTVGIQALALTARGAARFKAQGGGILVVSVEPESPAEACGLHPGDVVETANGKAFTRAAFQQLLRDSLEGPINLGVIRSGEKKSVAFSFDCAADARK
jgi:serine protease Do